MAAIRVGGKGSSLSSSSVYAVANGLAQVNIDSSALDRLSSSSSSTANLKPYHLISLPTAEESRASHLVLLSKLLSIPKLRAQIPQRIAAALNSQEESALELTEDEALALDKLKPSSALYGLCALLDHQSAALCTVSDAVAALSCEALKADVASFGSVDSGDGLGSKDVIGVAGDLKVLLNGSNLVGKVEIREVSEVPKIHGSLRELVRLVHAKTREELNKGGGGRGGGGSGWPERTALEAVATALFALGNYSLRRAKMNLEAVGSEDLRSTLVALFEKECPSGESLRSEIKLVKELGLDEEEESCVEFGHQVMVLMGLVWRIVTWEAITVFVALEGAELTTGKGEGGAVSEQVNATGKGEGGALSEQVNAKADKKSDNNKKKKKVTALEGAELTGKGEGGAVSEQVNAKADKKSDNNNNKKVALGRGTSVMVQLIKDKLQGKGGDAADSSGLLKTWVKELLLFLDPRNSEFGDLLNKVKEIVESNESRRLPKLPKGTRDFAKEQMTIRKRAFSIIEDVFERHGATALDTPVFELRDTLMGKYGEDSKLIYDLADQGGELSSLRYDLTVPFARYVAMNGITSFKRYQIAKVYRRDNPSKGRYREFYQCDFDIAGQGEKMGPDFEAVYVLTELLDELNIGGYEVKLNHRKLLDGMLEICGVPSEKFRTICSSIDKLDKQPFDKIKKEMVEEKGLSVETADKIGSFVKHRGHPLKLLSELKQEGSEFLENSASLEALNDLDILFKYLEKSKCIGKVVFDLSLARGLDYYTGVIYEAVLKGGPQMGSIAAGGRYDNLIGMFGTKQVPAVGVSLGIERVFAIMEQIHKDQNQTTRATKTEVLVSILVDDGELAASISGELWKSKISTEFLVNKRKEKHFSRAVDSKIPWMIMVGEKEQTGGVVKLINTATELKNTATTEENLIPRSKIVEELKKRLSA